LKSDAGIGDPRATYRARRSLPVASPATIIFNRPCFRLALGKFDRTSSAATTIATTTISNINPVRKFGNGGA
jgi:hypothetical protein